MNEFFDLRNRFPGIIRAFVVGLPAGAVFSWFDTPIPWMIGPMVAVAVANLLGHQVFALPYGRQIGQVVLGSAVGIYFTPPVVVALGANFGAILLATASAFLIGGLGAVTLSRVAGVDGKSAFFASIPGGAMAMAVLAEKFGAAMPPVAVAQSLRISIVVIVIPFLLTYGGIPMEPSAYKPQLSLTYFILVPWIAFGFVLGEIAERFRIHNGFLIAPIFFGAILTINGVELSEVPSWLTDIAQLMFGLVLGERYERAFFARHKLFIPFALVNAFLVLAASALVGISLSWGFGFPLSSMIISTAPGGMAEMAIVAQSLQIGVPTVVAFHLFRVVIVSLGTQHIYVSAVTLLKFIKKN